MKAGTLPGREYAARQRPPNSPMRLCAAIQHDLTYHVNGLAPGKDDNCLRADACSRKVRLTYLLGE